MNFKALKIKVFKINLILSQMEVAYFRVNPKSGTDFRWSFTLSRKIHAGHRANESETHKNPDQTYDKGKVSIGGTYLNFC